MATVINAPLNVSLSFNLFSTFSSHLKDVLNLHASAVGLLEDGLGTSQCLLQLLGLRGQHKHTDLPEEGLRQDGVRLQALEKLLRE